jgi:TetR/AcrR family transcriptional regulator, transcriptional repressor for nem operon
VRYPEDHKAAVHDRLLARAAKLVRRDGIARASVARVMASAKMTVGGFYRHFASQDAMVAEALAEALRDVRPLLFQGLDGQSGRAFEHGFVERYLSLHHYGNVAAGCPVAANVSEIARAPGLMSAGSPLGGEVASFMAYMEHRVRPTPNAAARAWLIMACVIGGLALARAQGAERGPRLLATIRTSLLEALDASA